MCCFSFLCAFLYWESKWYVVYLTIKIRMCIRIWAHLFSGCSRFFRLFVWLFSHVCWCFFRLFFLFQLRLYGNCSCVWCRISIFLLLCRKDRHSEIGIIASASTDDKRYGWWFFGWAVRKHELLTAFYNSNFLGYFHLDVAWHVRRGLAYNEFHAHAHAYTHKRFAHLFLQTDIRTIECLLFIAAKVTLFMSFFPSSFVVDEKNRILVPLFPSFFQFIHINFRYMYVRSRQQQLIMLRNCYLLHTTTLI